MSSLSMLVLATMAYGYLESNGYFRKIENVSIKLTLRKLNLSGKEMIGGSRSENVFAIELNELFVAVTELFDFAVMKALSGGVRILIAQEHQHAVLHKDATKESNELRFEPLYQLGKILMLRSGETLRNCLCLGFELSSSSVLYMLSSHPRIIGFESDLILFHFFEEIEHGAVTASELKKRTTVLQRILSLPIVVAFWMLVLLFPVFSRFVASPTFNVKVFRDLLGYLSAAVPAFFMACFMLFAFYVFPGTVGETREKRTVMLKHFENQITQRSNIQIENLDSESYIVLM